MLRRALSILAVLAWLTAMFAVGLVAQAPARYILTARTDMPGAADSSIAAVARLGGRAEINSIADYGTTVKAIVAVSRVRDSLWLSTDTSRVLVTGPWKRWLVAAEYDGLVRVPTDSTAELGGALSLPWGVEAVGAPAAWAMGARGQGVIVTSLDSGIDPTHPGYTVAGGYNAVARADTGWADNISACNGHGTHIAGTAAGKITGVAPGATLFGVKVFSPLPCGAYTSDQVAGLNWAVGHGSRCINVSIGNTGLPFSYNQAITAAVAAGAIVGGANGNSGSTPAQFPGNADKSLGVASVGGGWTRSGFSNYGPTTDLAAPGEGVESTMPGGGYGNKSGTSMATPHVIGVCAIGFSEAPQLSGDSMMTLMKATALPIGSPIPNDYTGWGMPRADRLVAALRGGLAIAAPTTDTIPPTAALVPVCKPVVALRPWTASADVLWLRVTTTPDTLCYSIDPALVPTGSDSLIGTITTRSTP